MQEPIPVSLLNDFFFCPYSIYLHQIYQGTEEETIKASPQLEGTVAHMIIVSYDIKNDKLRASFSKKLEALGATRLQYSVFEARNSSRIIDNLRFIIKDEFGPKFCMDDSVCIFHCNEDKTEKYGNSVHRDKDLLFF